MPRPPRFQLDASSRAALPLVAVFAVTSLVWIGVSDGLIPLFSSNVDAWVALSRGKGFLFIVLCSILLFVLIRRQHAKLLTANRTLGRQKDELRAVFRANPHPMWIYDRHTLAVLLVNEAAVRTYGYSEATWLTMSVADLQPPENLDKFLKYLGSPEYARGLSRWRHRHSDGSTALVEVRGEDIELDGRSARLVIATDISERLRTEQMLRLAEAAFSSTHESIVITDTQGLIVTVNPAFTAITGYPSAECVGKSPTFLLSPRQDAAACQRMVLELKTHGHWQGEGWCQRKDGTEYMAWLSVSAVTNAKQQLRNYIAIAHDLTDRKAAEDRIHKLVHYDDLTALPNRTLLEARLALAVVASAAAGHELAVVFVNLDHVKRINDSLGHGTGDLVLRNAASRLCRVAEEEDLVSRWGGDEFVLVLPNAGPGRALALAQIVLDCIAEPFMVEGETITVTASAGISIFPQDGNSAPMLLRNAGTALHYAKDEGRNSVRFFRAELDIAVRERHTLENALRLALPHHELEVHYQPQIRLADGAIVGMEALLRWRSPELGSIPPSKFIPIAEANGLMIEIGTWVLHQVCAQAAAWRAEGLAALRMAVNMSAVQLRSPAIVDVVRAALEGVSLPPHTIEIEVTENFVLELTEEMRSRFEAMRELGVQFAIDDFGTGYSSLNYLRSLPVQAIKIDQSFVHQMLVDPQGIALPHTIIAIGHNFGMRVVAEGVETDEQCSVLADLGCDEGQGYLFARPMSAAAATEWLRQRHGADGRLVLGDPRETSPEV